MAENESPGAGDRGAVENTEDDAGPPDQLSARASDLLERVGPKPTTKEGRIGVIIELMASNEWVTGLTGRLLAEAWAMPYATVRGDTAEASRAFNVPEEERDALRARWHAKVESAQVQARQLKRMEALGTLLKLEGDHLGVFEPAKVEISGSLSDLLGKALGQDGDEPPEPVEE